jgi:hypothetical protein
MDIRRCNNHLLDLNIRLGMDIRRCNNHLLDLNIQIYYLHLADATIYDIHFSLQVTQTNDSVVKYTFATKLFLLKNGPRKIFKGDKSIDTD